MSYYQNGVMIYSTPTCQYRRAAKYLLEQYGVPYRDVDVSTDVAAAQEMLYKSGQLGTPAIDIDGSLITGYEPLSIVTALKQHGYIQ